MAPTLAVPGLLIQTVKISCHSFVSSKFTVTETSQEKTVNKISLLQTAFHVVFVSDANVFLLKKGCLTFSS